MSQPPQLLEEIIYMVQNDTAPDRKFVVSREGYDFTGATAKFGIRSRTTGLLTNNAHLDCVVTNDELGSVEATYVFQTGDLPDAGGDYECDLQLTISGKDETVWRKVLIKTRAQNI